ncbi:acetolactate synthase large subunit [Thiomicrorhabdus lithotrophica]|uniref:Acetolactate synthase large subunit n=1 Tax=Thiomicrorhabdus lithotrophica TaxID=2949997 RepID=A0ABY8CAH7_9GAMM|nr:acetolactate synthase large subunit [Thiomicrorhabdus lithotrophica]WEJ62237.1 acetolactate synthase large subunit [Thiomicrorhabdus lithotrophica]
MKAAEVFVKCLENEEVEYIFGIPGEENLDLMDALLDSHIKFILTRHEQGAAFMADVYGRLTGQAGVCLATLGPGATNLVTGVADANMDRAPVVAIAGQASTQRLHKESHQVLDLVNLFKPITKYSTQILTPEVIPEVVRKAFKVAQAEKPGCSFIDFPENIAEQPLDKPPLKKQSPLPSYVNPLKVEQASEIISNAKFPIIIAGNGVIRSQASDALFEFATKLNIPVATTFMAKGALPCSNELSLGTIGLQAHDYISCGIDRADVVICVGYDIVEYHPHLWNRNPETKIIHIDTQPAEVDEFYIVAAGLIGNIGQALESIAALSKRHTGSPYQGLKQRIEETFHQLDNSESFPVKPQKILTDLRKALDIEDIIISDVGAHKMWIARMYQAQSPNSCIISNGFASMGIALPGAIAAKLAKPNQVTVAVTGDAGFMMNVQEIETAVRLNIPIIVLIWNDAQYGLIQWKQMNQFGRESNVSFTNPDFVKLAEAFGAKGYKIEQTEDLLPTLKQAIKDNCVVLIDCPVDYSENLKLTEELGEMICPT